jgi:hypothetical protein
MSMLLAVDDGLANANYNWADIFFIIGAILAVLSALATTPVAAAVSKYAHILLALAVACISFALFLL